MSDLSKSMHAKKIVREEVPAFCEIIGRERAERLSRLAESFKVARANGLSVLAYLDYTLPKDKAERVGAIDDEVKALTESVSSGLAEKLKKAEPEDYATTIADYEPTRMAIQGEIVALQSEKRILQSDDGAVGAFVETYDSVIRHGHVKTAMDTDTPVDEKMANGVYRAKFAGEEYRFVRVNGSDWYVFAAHVDDDDARTFEQLAHVKYLQLDEGTDSYVKSLTRARKAMRVFATGYLGFKGQDALIAALDASFEHYSASNPTKKNTVRVAKDANKWLAQFSETGKPHEYLDGVKDEPANTDTESTD